MDGLTPPARRPPSGVNPAVLACPPEDLPMYCTALLLAAGLGLTSPAGEPLPDLVRDDAPVHLGISLPVTHLQELAELRRAQQDPTSPDYRRWLTPAEYGARFGQPVADYARVSAWLRAQ